MGVISVEEYVAPKRVKESHLPFDRSREWTDPHRAFDFEIRTRWRPSTTGQAAGTGVIVGEAGALENNGRVLFWNGWYCRGEEIDWSWHAWTKADQSARIGWGVL